MAYVDVVETFAHGKSVAATRAMIDELIEQPPKPLREAWGMSEAARRGAAAAMRDAGGPAPLRQ